MQIKEAFEYCFEKMPKNFKSSHQQQKIHIVHYEKRKKYLKIHVDQWFTDISSALKWKVKLDHTNVKTNVCILYRNSTYLYYLLHKNCVMYYNAYLILSIELFFIPLKDKFLFIYYPVFSALFLKKAIYAIHL